MNYEDNFDKAKRVVRQIPVSCLRSRHGMGGGTYVDEPPDVNDLGMWLKTRSGLTFIDKYGNDAEILLPCFLNSGSASILGDKTRTEEKIFDGNDHTIYFQFRQIEDVNPASAYDIVSFGGGTVNTRRGIELRAVYNGLRIYAADGATRYFKILVTTINTLLKDQGVFDVIINVYGTTQMATCSVYDSDNNIVGSSMNQDISAFVFNNDDNYEPFTFNSQYFIVDNVKKFNSVKTLSQCQTDLYRSDLQLHLPNILSGADISGNGLDFSYSSMTVDDIYYSNINSWALEYGSDRYEIGLDATYGRTVCRDNSLNSYIPSREAGATWVGSRIVGEFYSGIINSGDCAIRFSNAFFDRSNSTIWKAAARSGYYNVSDPLVFHISELSQRNFYNWINDGYKGRAYVNFVNNSIEKFDRKSIKSIFLYNTDRTGSDNVLTLAYTNDLFAVVQDGGHAPTFNSYGYAKFGILKSVSPMLTMRIDDGYADIPTDWRPFFNQYDINIIVGIHAAEVGTSGTYNFATWQQLKDMYNTPPRYISACHNNYDVDYSSLAYVDEIEQRMITGKNAQEAQKIPCHYYMGNRHSSSNPSVPYFAHKVGFVSHLAASIYGKGGVEGANPREVDLYRICAVACDLAGNFDLTQVDNTDEINNVKALMDTAITENRWLILFVHAYRDKVKNAFIELFQYAQSIGLEFYSYDEAIANCKYL